MNDSELLKHAEEFLLKRQIRFVKPGKFGARENTLVEIIFLVPEALNPRAVVDPPDVRLWVDSVSGKIEIQEQM